MIAVNAISKSFGKTRALDAFNLSVSTGELVGLVGPNGAGKTTLIRILSTLSFPDHGAANVASFDVVRDRPGVRKTIGYMPDQPGIYQEMRVIEFLEFFADAFKLRPPERQIAIDRALAQSRLTDRRDEFVEQLSMGMRQRLLLAKTLLHSPRVLLLDEPATGLDPLARIDLREQLKQLSRDGVTILLSSHILSDLEDICTRVVFIGAGKNTPLPADPAAPAADSPLRPQTSCKVEVIGDVAAAANSARGFPAVSSVSQQGATLHVVVAGDASIAAALLRHLVTSGVSVLRFEPLVHNLESQYRRAFSEKKE